MDVVCCLKEIITFWHPFLFLDQNSTNSTVSTWVAHSCPIWEVSSEELWNVFSSLPCTWRYHLETVRSGVLVGWILSYLPGGHVQPGNWRTYINFKVQWLLATRWNMFKGGISNLETSPLQRQAREVFLAYCLDLLRQLFFWWGVCSKETWTSSMGRMFWIKCFLKTPRT